MKRRSPQEVLIETARKQLGYQALPNRNTPFGQRTGYPNQKWDGSFVEFCFQETGLRHTTLPVHVSTTSALQWYLRNGRAFKEPRPGDLVFFAFSTDSTYGEPHIGIVTDTSQFKTDGVFRTIEAQIDSGLPRARKEPDGVFERTRYLTDVLLFARPFYLPESKKTTSPKSNGEPTKLHKVRVSHFQNGKAHRSVELVQIMLAETVGLSEVRRGFWDAKTRSAYAAWQRRIGYVAHEVNGEPDVKSLSRLASQRQLPIFEVRG